jgi:hypothetical protein
MDSVTWDVIVVLLTGAVWLAAAIWQANNIRRQEKMLVWLWWMSLPRRPGAAPAAPALDVPQAVEGPRPLGNRMRPTDRWTVG